MEKSDKQVGTTARLTKEDAMRIKLTMGVPMLAATLEVAAGLALKLDMLEIKGGYELNC